VTAVVDGTKFVFLLDKVRLVVHISGKCSRSGTIARSSRVPTAWRCPTTTSSK
jgi:hypothetical protein